jgi:hypothetical protein
MHAPTKLGSHQSVAAFGHDKRRMIEMGDGDNRSLPATSGRSKIEISSLVPS